MNIKDQTLKELKNLCKENNLKNYSKLDKDNLVKFIKKNMKGGTDPSIKNINPIKQTDPSIKNINLIKDTKETIDNIYNYIDKNKNKTIILKRENDKIIIKPSGTITHQYLTTEFQKLDELNKYLINLYKSNEENGVITNILLRNLCERLNLEIIYKSRSTFSTKFPSLLIDVKKLMSKIIRNKNLTTDKNYFTTLKGFIKKNYGSHNNLGIPKEKYNVNYSCVGTPRMNVYGRYPEGSKKNIYNMFDDKNLYKS